MECLPTLQELHSAAKALSAAKIPGPDGIPSEFFLSNWETIGTTLLRATLEGIAAGKLHQRFTEGLLVLLAKRGNLRFLVNRRPLTLLNLIYKLVAKAYQLRLTAVLQRFISEDQSAFIKGRTIHHSLFLTNEVLHEASIQDEDYMYLKLDIVKAFDKIEWPFLLAILRKFGFGPTFLKFVSAS